MERYLDGLGISYRIIDLPSYTLLSLMERGKVVAIASYSFGGEGEVYLHTLQVKEQGRGVGRFFLTLLLQYFVGTLGCRMRLSPFDGVASFYRRVVGETPYVMEVDEEGEMVIGPP